MPAHPAPVSHRLRPLSWLALAAAFALPAGAEEAGRCGHWDALRHPFFGTTHLHTGYSFDARIRFVPSTPREAYRFAKKEAPLPGVDPWGIVDRAYEIDQPLDWGMVTDHAEYFGEMGICLAAPEDVGTAVSPEAYYSLDCQLLRGFYWQPGKESDRGVPIAAEGGSRLPPPAKRAQASAAFGVLVAPALAPGSKNAHLPLCESGLGDCKASELSVWGEMQSAANENYEKCRFTTFIGYEAASTPSGTNWHRNVIFRNEHVIERPITAVDMARVENRDPNTTPMEWLTAPAVEKLWSGLRERCLDAGTGCDVLTIPHNSNLGGGVGSPNGPLLVPPLFFDPRGRTLEEKRQDALARQLMEPLVEVFQDKGSSECRFDPRFNAGVDTTDELCSFEILDTTTLLGASGVGGGGGGGTVPPEDFNSRAFVRNVLKDGLTYQDQLGVNPFKLGLVAASDSHNGTMGWHPEDASYGGHEGIEDAVPVTTNNNIQNNSGGHSVVWAEENGRDSIFDALKRRETYGTSGTRPVVRFFGGFGKDFSDGLCADARRLAEVGYAAGVPMGGDLDAARSAKSGGKPTFLFAAWKDDFVKTPLQRVQVIKGWYDPETQETHEEVVDVAGGPNGAGVDPDTCEPTGPGHDRLCGTWTDEAFDPSQPAFYYLRVLENPVCRYSTHICREHYGVDPLSTSCSNQLLKLQASDPAKAAEAAACCNNETTAYFTQPVIQERAWTSPIWFTPAKGGR